MEGVCERGAVPFHTGSHRQVSRCIIDDKYITGIKPMRIRSEILSMYNSAGSSV